ncbi:hypothetical protein JCM10908_004965 [Rhodotorula pacifica]|uniref:uncharacterized protein n=1 Tax=Rhodotorula pacifica TaxID=1495444 RepID=UPI003182A064
MYRFTAPTEGDSKSQSHAESSDAVGPSDPRQFESAVEGKSSKAPLPLPAASAGASPRKRRPTIGEHLITREPGSGQLFADALDLGPAYSYDSARTASVPLPQTTTTPPSQPLQPLPPEPGKLKRVRTMPSIDPKNYAAALPALSSPTSAMSRQELSVSDEETAALIAAAAEATDFTAKHFKQDSLGDTLGLPTVASHPLALAVGQRQDALDSAQPLEHLPKLEEGSTDPTAYPNWHVLADREVELSRLNNGDRLDAVLADPEASESLRAFAATLPDPRASLLLSLYTDLAAFSSQAANLRLASSAISKSYFLANSPMRLSLNISQRGPTLAVLYRTAAVGHGLNEPLQAIKREVDEQVLELWVQETAIKKFKERLGMWQTGAGWTGRLVIGGAGPEERSDGLTESFCLTDPSLHDNTIVAASEGFAMVTGYPVPEIVGRNCRFLQGPGTSPASVKPLREALLKGERVTWTVFNYRRDGTPYYNLICLNPLRDGQGKVRFILGGQTDATNTMQQVLPVSGFDSRQAPPGFSVTVQEQLEHLHPRGKSANGAPRVPSPGLLPPQPEYPYTPPEQSMSDQLLGAPGLEPGPRPSLLRRGRGLSRVWKRSTSYKNGDDEYSNGNGSNGNRKNDTADFTPSNTYVRIALVNAPDYKVLYATPELAKLVGLSRSAHASLAGTELVDLIKAPLPTSATSPKDEDVKEQTRRLRRNVGMAMEQGHAYKGFIRIKPQAKKNKLLGKATKPSEPEDFQHAVLHLTPLKSAEGKITHFVAIFG